MMMWDRCVARGWRSRLRVATVCCAGVLGSLGVASCSTGAELVTPDVPVLPADTVIAPRDTTARGPTGPFTLGAVLSDSRDWIEYTVGDAPLVIVAPHGGLLSPGELPDRACAECVTINDANTQDLARAIADAFAARTGRRPHLIVNRLHRRKFDANRDRVEATDGEMALDGTWEWLHAAVDTASALAARQWQRGLVIDLHGHGHAIARLELGYLLSAAQLRLSDSTLDVGRAIEGSSIARLARESLSGSTTAALLRGPTSLGGLLQTRGIAAVPSPAAPAPATGDPYFNGGFNTQRHGSRNGGRLDAVQIECHYSGVRDLPENRRAFADTLTSVLIEFMAREYGWAP